MIPKLEYKLTDIYFEKKEFGLLKLVNYYILFYIFVFYSNSILIRF